MLFFCADFPGNTDKLHGRSTGGGRVSRSVWSAWSLLPLSNRATHPTAGASSTHSIRFAPFRSDSAGLRTDTPTRYNGRHYAKSDSTTCESSDSRIIWNEVMMQLGQFKTLN